MDDDDNKCWKWGGVTLTIGGLVCCCVFAVLVAISVVYIYKPEKKHSHRATCEIIACVITDTTCRRSLDLWGGEDLDPLEDAKDHKSKDFNKKIKRNPLNRRQDDGDSDGDEDEDSSISAGTRTVTRGTGGSYSYDDGGGSSSSSCSYAHMDITLTLPMDCPLGDNSTKQIQTNNGIYPGDTANEQTQLIINSTIYCRYQKHVVFSKGEYSPYCQTHNSTYCYYDDRKIYSSLRVDNGDPTGGGKAALSVFSLATFVCFLISLCGLCMLGYAMISSPLPTGQGL